MLLGDKNIICKIKSKQFIIYELYEYDDKLLKKLQSKYIHVQVINRTDGYCYKCFKHYKPIESKPIGIDLGGAVLPCNFHGLMIIGSIGSGKSYLANYILSKCTSKYKFVYNAFDEDFLRIERIESSQLETLESATLVIDEYLTLDKQSINTIKKLLVVARHKNLNIVLISQIANKSDLTLRNLIRYRVSFRLNEQDEYKLVFGCIPVQPLQKDYDFYYSNGKEINVCGSFNVLDR